MLAANKFTPLPDSITSKAVQLLISHHGSSIGAMVQKEKQMWLCKTCKGRDGKQYRNMAFRTACHLCGVGKGSCFGGPVPTIEPSQRTLAAEQVHAAKLKEKEDRKAMDAAAFKKQQAELKRLQQKIDLLESKQGGAAAVQARGDEASSEQGFKEKLRALEEEKAACEKFGYQENLAKVINAIKELKGSKEAAVPEGHQLRKAEQELAKRKKRSMANQAALEEAKKKVDDLEAKCQEDAERLQEAELDLQKIKARITSPSHTGARASWETIAKGGKEFLEVVPPQFLDHAGIGASEKSLISELLKKMGAAQAAFRDWKQAEDDKQAQSAAAHSAEGAGGKSELQGREEGQEADVDMREDPSSLVAGVGAPVVASHRHDATLEKLQQLASSSNPDEAEAARVALCALGEPKSATRSRTAPY